MMAGTMCAPAATGRAARRSGGGDVATREADLLRALHDEHAGVLWAYVVNLTNGDRGKAQDVVQETLLRAWRNPSVLEQSNGSARGWLFTVARRIVIDEWRSTRNKPEVVTEAVPDRGTPDLTGRIADRQLVVAAMRTLSPEHREVIAECYFRGSTVTQAAATLGIPAGTVKSRSHYALRALRLAIEELGGAP
jgi:RNA polymerase sigma-70 factor (ECF subfamily)